MPANPEGWYENPFGVHEDRWFSDGAPTALVRDKGMESNDQPPSPGYEGELTQSEDEGEANPDDAFRADGTGATVDPYQGVRMGPDWWGQPQPR